MSHSRALTQGTFGLERIVCELPPSQTIEELVLEASLGEEQAQSLRSGGLRAVPVAPPGPLSDLVGAVLRRLVSEVDADRIRGVVLAHSVPVIAPMDVPVLETVLSQVGLDGTPAVAVAGQPCAILHTALRLAGAWITQLPGGSAVLVVGADRAYSAAGRLFFGSAMGDAAVAALAVQSAVRNRVLASYHHSEIFASRGEKSPPESIAAFRECNPALIRSAIMACLARGGCSLSDVALIVPHTPYLTIWDLVAKLLGIDRGRILTDFIGETGHLNSNDSLVHYDRAVREGRLRRGDLALLINPGFGGTRGCTLLRC